MKTKKLNSLINEIENYIIELDKKNEAISKSSIGWHIEHSAKVICQITEAIEKSNPKEYKRNFNLNRLIIFTRNKIPRGKGKAPKSVMPEGEINMATLKQHIERVKLSTKQLEILNPNNHFKHPYFGILNLDRTKTFLVLHTNHHIQIIKDILLNKI